MLRLAGVVGLPSHHHPACTYHPWFRPLDPHDEGTFLALRHATRSLSLLDASWAIALGEVTLDGAPVALAADEDVRADQPRAAGVDDLSSVRLDAVASSERDFALVPLP
ncbi:MAG: hypothetical protein IPF99_25985 [Deltaproteobacteria bacterium]|nr:hypothetical protein [Deltaproteobacteria bacterium]